MNNVHSATVSLKKELFQATEFGQAFQSRRLPQECTVGFLRALAACYAVVDRESLEPLQRKLYALRYQLIPDRTDAAALTVSFVASLRVRLKDAPTGRHGYRWALDTIRTVLYPEMLNTLEPDAQDDDQAGPEEAVTAAVETYRFFIELAGALYPVRSELHGYSSFTLNPAGGNYPVCQTTEELQAVLHASDRALAMNPYFLLRFGTSAWLFSDSDGAWLATLPRLEGSAMDDQIDWLIGILSVRGMPSILLARHLRILADELTRAVPRESNLWQRLGNKADEIDPPERARTRRETAPFAAGFAAQEATEIVLAAVADEENGYAGALDSVIGWYTDNARFTEAWIQGVTALTVRQ